MLNFPGFTDPHSQAPKHDTTVVQTVASGGEHFTGWNEHGLA